MVTEITFSEYCKLTQGKRPGEITQIMLQYKILPKKTPKAEERPVSTQTEQAKASAPQQTPNTSGTQNSRTRGVDVAKAPVPQILTPSLGTLNIRNRVDIAKADAPTSPAAFTAAEIAALNLFKGTHNLIAEMHPVHSSFGFLSSTEIKTMYKSDYIAAGIDMLKSKKAEVVYCGAAYLLLLSANSPKDASDIKDAIASLDPKTKAKLAKDAEVIAPRLKAFAETENALAGKNVNIQSFTVAKVLNLKGKYMFINSSNNFDAKDAQFFADNKAHTWLLNTHQNIAMGNYIDFMLQTDTIKSPVMTGARVETYKTIKRADVEVIFGTNDSWKRFCVNPNDADDLKFQWNTGTVILPYESSVAEFNTDEKGDFIRDKKGRLIDGYTGYTYTDPLADNPNGIKIGNKSMAKSKKKPETLVANHKQLESIRAAFGDLIQHAPETKVKIWDESRIMMIASSR